MIRLGLLGVVALAVGAIGAHFLLQDNGYVLLGIGGYVLETSLPVLVVLLVLGYLLVRALVRVTRAPRALRTALSEGRERRAGERLTRGLVRLLQGDLRRGEKLLARGAKRTGAPLADCLLAARAAQQHGMPGRRDAWLAAARERAPDAETAVLLTQAELELEAGELEAARTTLALVRESHPDHAVALALSFRTLSALGDRDGLVHLAGKLGRAALRDEETVRIAHEALEHAFAARELTRARVDALWSVVPGAARRAPELVRERALALARLGHGRDAEAELRAALDRDLEPGLVAVYAELEGADAAERLARIEHWLETEPENAGLYFAAARLSLANGDATKARNHFEKGLAFSPDPDAYVTYADLLEHLGDPAAAARAYATGLHLATGRRTDLSDLPQAIQQDTSAA